MLQQWPLRLRWKEVTLGGYAGRLRWKVMLGGYVGEVTLGKLRWVITLEMLRWGVYLGVGEQVDEL